MVDPPTLPPNAELVLKVTWDRSSQAPSPFSFQREIVKLLGGSPFPLEYVFSGSELTSAELVFAYFFMRRAALLDPLAMPLIQGLTLPPNLTAHLPPEIPALLQHLESFSKDISQGVSVVHAYFNGSISAPEVPSYDVVDVGTNGFVVVSSTGSCLSDGDWVSFDLYRQGHLRGVVFFHDGIHVFSKSVESWDLVSVKKNVDVVHEAARFPCLTWTRLGNLIGPTFLDRSQVLDLLTRSLHGFGDTSGRSFCRHYWFF